MATADETLAAACESKIACLSNRDLLIVIAEALSQGAGGGGDVTQVASVLLDHDQVRQLPTTPVQMFE